MSPEGHFLLGKEDGAVYQPFQDLPVERHPVVVLVDLQLRCTIKFIINYVYFYPNNEYLSIIKIIYLFLLSNTTL